MRKIEVCSTSVSDVEAAYKGGAIRVELCSALTADGVTPSYGVIKQSIEVGIPVNVLIRPREGDFVYTQEEIDVMIEDIKICKHLGVNGFVIGALDENGDIDRKAIRQLIDEIKSNNSNFEITFHRAFDECKNTEKALEDIIELGCDRLLTSGCQKSAWEGRETIQKLVKQANGRIIIMAGAGVKPENIVELERITTATEFHSSAREKIKSNSDSIFGCRPQPTSVKIVEKLATLT